MVIISTIIVAATTGYNQAIAAETKAQIKAKLNGEEVVPPVSTTAEGKIKLKVKESNIKYKLNITGITDTTMVDIHEGLVGENGEPVVDLLTDGNMQKTSNGLLINGSIVDSSLIGPMKGKTSSDFADSVNVGKIYVDVHTQTNPDGEIRGQLVTSVKNATSAVEDDTEP